MIISYKLRNTESLRVTRKKMLKESLENNFKLYEKYISVDFSNVNH